VPVIKTTSLDGGTFPVCTGKSEEYFETKLTISSTPISEVVLEELNNEDMY
jgi:hypothetical protein